MPNTTIPLSSMASPVLHIFTASSIQKLPKTVVAEPQRRRCNAGRGAMLPLPFFVCECVRVCETRGGACLARIARGQTYPLTLGVTSPLQGAEQRIWHLSPLKRGRDPGSQTICLPPGYPDKVGGARQLAGAEGPRVVRFLVSEVPLYPAICHILDSQGQMLDLALSQTCLNHGQGYLAHKKTPPPRTLP